MVPYEPAKPPGDEERYSMDHEAEDAHGHERKENIVAASYEAFAPLCAAR